MTVPTESAVIVAVPAAEQVVAEHRGRFDSSARRGVPAHVTVLYPFVAPAEIDAAVLTRLARAAAAVPAFSASFLRTDWFADDVLWLAPDPEDSFRALTTAVSNAFPNLRPYGGKFDDVVPHLTVADHGSPDELRAIERDVLQHLPVVMRVDEIQVICGTAAEGSWHQVAALPLG